MLKYTRTQWHYWRNAGFLMKNSAVCQGKWHSPLHGQLRLNRLHAPLLGCCWAHHKYTAEAVSLARPTCLPGYGCPCLLPAQCLQPPVSVLFQIVEPWLPAETVWPGHCPHVSPPTGFLWLVALVVPPQGRGHVGARRLRAP